MLHRRAGLVSLDLLVRPLREQTWWHQRVTGLEGHSRTQDKAMHTRVYSCTGSSATKHQEADRQASTRAGLESWPRPLCLWPSASYQCFTPQGQEIRFQSHSCSIIDSFSLKKERENVQVPAAGRCDGSAASGL